MTTHKEALTLALEMVQNKMYAHAEMYLKEALAQPEQEPVAWMRDDEMKAMVSDEKQAWILCGQSELIEDYNKPLYTNPPQRTWVGLTEEEKDNFWKADQMTNSEWSQLFADIEAKLKEKNT